MNSAPGRIAPPDTMRTMCLMKPRSVLPGTIGSPVGEKNSFVSPLLPLPMKSGVSVSRESSMRPLFAPPAHT